MFDDFSTLIARRLDNALEAVAALRDRVVELEAMGKAIIRTLEGGGTVYTCGNGGSAAEAMHLAEELIGRYRSDRRPLRAVCLNSDPTALTCIANDFGYEQVFARQCEALVGEGDCLVAFSTSGSSPNVVAALRTARKQGAATIGLLGGDGGECREQADHALIAHGPDAAAIQEAHQVVLHIFCEMIEAALSG